jgi:hypothetical protein
MINEKYFFGGEMGVLIRKDGRNRWWHSMGTQAMLEKLFQGCDVESHKKTMRGPGLVKTISAQCSWFL